MSLKSLLPAARNRVVGRAELRPFAALQRKIDRLFDDFARGFQAFGFAAADLAPTMDVAQTDKEIDVTVELPGLEEKDVQIHIADNVLTMHGEKRADKQEKDENYRLLERSYGAFSRTVELPDGANPEAIRATIKGVLKVTVPKPAPAQVKKIELKTAA